MKIKTNTKSANDLEKYFNETPSVIVAELIKIYLRVNEFAEESDTGLILDHVDEFQYRGIIDALYLEFTGSLPNERQAETMYIVLENVEMV